MKGITKEMDWLPEICLGRYRSGGSGDDFSLGTLHMMRSSHPCGAHSCFLLTSLPDAEHKERKKNSVRFKYFNSCKDRGTGVTHKFALYMLQSHSALQHRNLIFLSSIT